VSVIAIGGITQDPIFTLSLSAATTPVQMLISDDPTFPVQFPWEPFAPTKDFHTDGTKYIYAKFKDASGNESAIAFVRPSRIMYIQKSETLAGRPVLINVRVASDLNVSQVKTFYRAIGDFTYTQLTMTLADGIYSAWIPASQTANGIEYYIQVEGTSNNVLATLPEENPSTSPFLLSAVDILSQSVVATKDNAFEFAVGITVEIPAGAVQNNTDLQVSAFSTPPTPPGLTPTDIGYNLTMSDGTTHFNQPVRLTFSYADSDISELDESRLRVYYQDGGQIKPAGGNVNATGNIVSVGVDSFN
jgi:hypothetical protein